ncbi:MAG: AI-2E family transporter, partial [Myxococcota bacterium]
LGVVTTGVVLVVPQFVAEIVRFGQTLPEEIQAFRTESLPRYNQQLKDAVQDYLPALDPSFEEVPVEEKSPQVTRSDVDAVRNTVRLAWRKSASMAAAQAEAQARVMRTARGVRVRKSVSLDVETLEPTTQIVADMAPGAQRALGERMFRPTFGSWVVAPSTQPALKLVSSATGFDVYLGDEELEVKQTGEKTWRVREVRPRREESEQGLEDVLDLEKGLSEVLGELAQTSADQLASVIALAQALVVGIIEAFVALVLTLMVAAFISIDLPGVMSFFRGLIPSEHRVGYDRLLGEVDRGLGGVVRGQLLICLVNGVLTYIGLLILDVKFSVLLAVVAGVLSLIPIFGTILSTIPIVLFGLTDGLTTGLLALVWILGIHFIEANFLNPKIIGTSAHIHPVIVIFALLAGESAFGLVGALLAVPTASIVLTFFNFFVTHQRQRRGDPEVQGTHEDGEDARNVVA